MASFAIFATPGGRVAVNVDQVVSVSAQYPDISLIALHGEQYALTVEGGLTDVLEALRTAQTKGATR